MNNAIAVCFFGLLAGWAFWEAYRWSPERFPGAQDPKTVYWPVWSKLRHAAFSRRELTLYGCLFLLMFAMALAAGGA